MDSPHLILSSRRRGDQRGFFYTDVPGWPQSTCSRSAKARCGDLPCYVNPDAR
ncbi:hypothetical protein OH799_12595 [Nocardia sp. NBC_00881]|uniref:hypothetical protein n=1 Tax=Nocardia sp. NBC_00881 TaxID=2975995 RepID=UPI0038652F88|nr:hypothetical protein OH799_12595 [Nocardia sp. NBC_00881]